MVDAHVFVSTHRNSQSCQLSHHSQVWEKIECVQEIQVQSSLTSASTSSITVTSSLLLEAEPVEAQDSFQQGESHLLSRTHTLQCTVSNILPSIIIGDAKCRQLYFYCSFSNPNLLISLSKKLTYIRLKPMTHFF